MRYINIWIYIWGRRILKWFSKVLWRSDSNWRRSNPIPVTTGRWGTGLLINNNKLTNGEFNWFHFLSVNGEQLHHCNSIIISKPSTLSISVIFHAFIAKNFRRAPGAHGLPVLLVTPSVGSGTLEFYAGKVFKIMLLIFRHITDDFNLK